MANMQSNDVFGSSKDTTKTKATVESTQAKASTKKDTPTTDDSKAATAKTAKSAKSEETKAADVKITESKPAAKKTRAAKTTAKPAAKKTAKKADEETVAAKKPAAKTTKTAAKKTTTRKTATKKKEITKSLYIQHCGKQIDEASLYERVIKDCESQNVTVEELKLYVKPEDNACYYVANGNVAGKVDLY